MGTEQMSQIFRTAESIQVVENTHHRVVQNFHRDFNDFCTPLSLILAGDYLPLVFNAGDRNENWESISKTLETSCPQGLLLFFHRIHPVID